MELASFRSFTVLPSQSRPPLQLLRLSSSSPTSFPFIIRPRKTVLVAAAAQLKESVAVESKSENEDNDNWEAALLDEYDPLKSLRLGKGQRIRRQRQLDNSASSLSTNDEHETADWAQRARQRALLALEARNPSAAAVLKKKIDPDRKQKKKKKKKKPKDNKVNNSLAKTKLLDKKSTSDISIDRIKDMNDNITRIEELDDGIDRIEDLDGDIDRIEDLDDDIDRREDLNDDNWETPMSISMFSFSSKSNDEVNERERIFNRRLIEAKDANEVLEIVGTTEERLKLLGFPSVLTPLNTATALHRIAKQMETCSMHKAERLAFARKRHMAELVARAMEVLPGFAAQGLSNVAWALSKVGGSTLYFSEMDLISEAASKKASDLNAQNVANILGAFASMQHAASSLFTRLSVRAAEIIETFNSQELAQVLWAHAELSEAADPLLDALDNFCFVLEKEYTSATSPRDARGPFANASPEHLANLSWSYAVLKQINRPSFKYLWQMLNCSIIRDSLKDWHLCQIYQVSLCLQYEYPQSGLVLSDTLKNRSSKAWEKEKKNACSSSSHQKDVQWFLVSMGWKCTAEYMGADYSLDLALVDKKVALEFDGPSHFVRNTGLALGHTTFKRRLLANSSWRVLSISYAEWEDLDGEAERMRFIRDKLNTVGLSV